MIPRIADIQSNLQKNKVLIIYGPRQVGKTTLVQEFLAKTSLKYLFYTGDDIEFANDFSRCNLENTKKMFSGVDLVVIDEAQKITNIGRALKLVVDHIPNIYIICTGSSSFDLPNSTDEPLTGRKNVINLYPIAIAELLKNETAYDINRKLSEYLIYGLYPNVVELKTYQEKESRIKEIKNAYLIKDILNFNRVKNAKVIIDLLKLLAFQVGSEASTLELGKNLGLDSKTVAKYLDLLEKAFVIFRLDGFSRNLRKEINKMSKYYFYDLGIRNAIISNFNGLSDRNDIGQLWENFLMAERMKANSYKKIAVNYYFWRTYDQKEIDLIEERAGNLYGYEFKWKKEKNIQPQMWLETYKNATYEIINDGNYLEFVK
jgi:uncharacterized protein